MPVCKESRAKHVTMRDALFLVRWKIFWHSVEHEEALFDALYFCQNFCAARIRAYITARNDWVKHISLLRCILYSILKLFLNNAAKYSLSEYELGVWIYLRLYEIWCCREKERRRGRGRKRDLESIMILYFCNDIWHCNCRSCGFIFQLSTFSLSLSPVTSFYCVRVVSLSTSLTMYHVGVALCQAVSQVLLSMRSHRLANTPIQYRYIPDNSTISVLRFSIIRHIREIEMYVYLFHSNFRARYYTKDPNTTICRCLIEETNLSSLITFTF